MYNCEKKQMGKLQMLVHSSRGIGNCLAFHSSEAKRNTPNVPPLVLISYSSWLIPNPWTEKDFKPLNTLLGSY